VTEVEVELQFTPTKTATPVMRDVVERAFADAQVPITRWTVPWGEDLGTTEALGLRWADPTLDVRLVRAPLDADHRTGALTAALCPGLGIALSTIRQELPDLPLGIVERASPRLALGVPTRLDARGVRRAFDRLPAEGLGPGPAWIWDEPADAWCELAISFAKRAPGGPFQIETKVERPAG
jgi:hypothetical protein